MIAHETYLAPGQRYVRADQFQLAVATGEIVPVIGAGQVADC